MTRQVTILLLGLGAFFLVIAGLNCPGQHPDDGDATDDGTTDDGAAGAVEMFAESAACTFCHQSLSDEEDNDVSIDAHWQSTMMANAARDPLFQAKVRSEIQRTPGLAAVIEDKCATCHTPMAHTQAVADGTAIALLDDGFLNAGHELGSLAIDGVSCALCHQIENSELGEEATFSGEYPIDVTTAKPDRLIYGPFSNPEEDTMQTASGYLPAFGAHVEDAGLCATCHTLFTPVVDSEGNVIGEFPEQTPYLEWEHSSFGDGEGEDRSCQSCHMPVAAGGVVVSTVPAGLPARSPFGQHHFVGGNTLMQQIFQTHRTNLGLVASDEELDATLQRTLTQLEENTANLAITGADLSDHTLTIDIQIKNNTGHKFPTGFPSRQAWIHLTITDAAETIVFESGAPQADGTIAGNNADEDAATFETHYSNISDAGQVQIYQTIMADSDGQITQTLLRALTYAKDNRLLPDGFDKQTADEAFAVHGNAEEDEDFLGGGDKISYQIDTTGHAGPFTVRAELLYQSVSYRFAEDLRSDSSQEIEEFFGLFDAADLTPVTVASATIDVAE